MPTPEPPRARRRSRWWGPLVALAATGLALVAAEKVLRNTKLYSTATELAGHGYVSPFDTSRFTQPWVGFGVARQVGEYQHREYQHRAPEYQYSVSLNSLGLRDDEHPTERAEHELRVAVIGDSFASSTGVAWESAWTEVLERRLAAARGGLPTRVIVGGVGGHDPAFSHYVLQLYLLPFQPDFVVLLVNGSDPHDLGVRGGFERFDEDGMVRPLWRPWFEPLVEHSHVVRALLMAPQPEGALSIIDPDLDPATAHALILNAATETASLAEEHGARFLVVAIPDRVTADTEDDLLRGFEAAAAERGVDAINLTGWMLDRVPEDGLGDYYHFVDQHFNAAGYRLLGEGVFAALAARGVPELQTP